MSSGFASRTCAVVVLACGLASLADIRGTDPLFKPGAACDYLVVAPGDAAFLSALEPLVTFKHEKGLKTRVVTVDSIVANVKGTDAQDKIRNLLGTAFREWGVTWVLLAGDNDKVPARQLHTRKAFMVDTETVVSDYYYACLDGDWDSGHNGIFGDDPESTYTVPICHPLCDGIRTVTVGPHVWPSVYLGRFPASTAAQLQAMVDKTLRYCSRPGASPHSGSALLFATYIGKMESGVKDGTALLHNRILPVIKGPASRLSSLNIQEMYEDSITPGGAAVVDSLEITAAMLDSSLSKGFNLVMFAAHGTSAGLNLCSFAQRPMYTPQQAGSIRSPAPSNVVSLSCGAMKTDPALGTSLAKELMADPDGGAVTYTGTSGTDYLTEKSDHYLYAFRLIADSGFTRLCKAMACANLKRDIQSKYATQFWGDPEIEFLSRSISPADTLAIDVSLGERTLLVKVTPPKDSVLVCVTGAGGAFSRGYTAADGAALLTDVTGGLDSVLVTATLYNYLPRKKTFRVDAIPVARPPAAGSRGGGLGLAVRQSRAGVVIRAAGLKEPLDIRVYSAAGRLVASPTLDKGRPVVTLRSLARDLYVVQARSRDTREFWAIIVER